MLSASRTARAARWLRRPALTTPSQRGTRTSGTGGAEPQPRLERTPFETLRVHRSASAADIKAAYLKLVKQYHPDRFQDDAERAVAQEKFLNIQAAFHALSSGQYIRSSHAASYSGQEAYARHEAPIENVYSIMCSCVGIGTVLFGVVCWWWSSGVSDGTRQHDMHKMIQEERCAMLERNAMLDRNLGMLQSASALLAPNDGIDLANTSNSRQHR